MIKPLVSVVVATYHRDISLRNALNSIGGQTYENFEIILVSDNHDTEWNEKVRLIVFDFEKKYDGACIRLIENDENKGSAETRNIGIRAAKGEYVTFLDDDDAYLPEKIENQTLKMIQENADYSVTDLFLYNENDKIIDKRIRTYIKSTDSQSLLEYHLMHHLTGTDTMMFKKDYLLKIGGFPPIDVGDEFYLMKEAISGNGKFLYVPGCNIKAYVHTGETGLSSGQSKIDGENTLYEYKKKFFGTISGKSRKYIKMRHHAVLAFAYLRIKKPIPVLKNSFAAFFIAPGDFIILYLERKK